jgi:hypothetical protein
MYLFKDNDWIEFGRTETIDNNHDPQFARLFELDYDLDDDRQRVRFEIYDIDNKTPQLSDDDFLGKIDTTLAEIVSGSPFTRPLMTKKNDKPAGGTITLRVREQSGRQDVLQLIFKASKLDNKDVIGKSDPFLEFSRQTADGHWEVVFRTEVVMNNLSPSWKPIQVKANLLSGGDLNNPIKVDCRDFDKNGKHELIGSFMTSVAEMIRDSKGREWPCINPAKQKKKHYNNSGVIILVSCESL